MRLLNFIIVFFLSNLTIAHSQIQNDSIIEKVELSKLFNSVSSKENVKKWISSEFSIPKSEIKFQQNSCLFEVKQEFKNNKPFQKFKVGDIIFQVNIKLDSISSKIVILDIKITEKGDKNVKSFEQFLKINNDLDLTFQINEQLRNIMDSFEYNVTGFWPTTNRVIKIRNINNIVSIPERIVIAVASELLTVTVLTGLGIIIGSIADGRNTNKTNLTLSFGVIGFSLGIPVGWYVGWGINNKVKSNKKKLIYNIND